LFKRFLMQKESQLVAVIGEPDTVDHNRLVNLYRDRTPALLHRFARNPAPAIELGRSRL
jgi:hypothetical protein